MEGLGGAASVIAVIDLAAKVASLCYQYSRAVKDAKADIERLLGKVNQTKGVLENTKRLLNGPDRDRLSTSQKLNQSLDSCFQQLEYLKMKLDPGSTRKTMSRIGLRALKWPLQSKDVDKILLNLDGFQQTLLLALNIDHIGLTINLNRKMDSTQTTVSAIKRDIDLTKLPTAKGASYDSHLDEHAARCLANTRVELQHKIMEWADDPKGKSIFWLNGMAGTGKSTIARTIAYSFASRNQLGASFFFKKGEGDRGNASRFFTTIAVHLVAHIPQLLPGVRETIDADPAISEKALKDQFEKLILSPLSHSRKSSSQPSQAIVVIDALDECEREEDIRAILQLLAQTKDIGTIRLRIFVTSRPELPVRLGFRKMDGGIYEDLLLHDVSRATIEHDISVFLQYELVRIRDDRELPEEWPGSTAIDILVGMAVPLFIFAATVCRFVGEAREVPQQRLKAILAYQDDDGVSQLDRTYLPILNHLFEASDGSDKKRRIAEFRVVVGAIILLGSPLSRVALASLLSMPMEYVQGRLDCLHSVLSIPKQQHAPIRLLHLSFRDFLLDPKKRLASPFWIDETETHNRLAKHCLELLSKVGSLRRNICNLVKPGTRRKDIDRQVIDDYLPAEVQYACRYWVSHLVKGGDRIQDGDQVHDFLMKHFLHWLEALSIMGNVVESISMMEALRPILEPNKSRRISDLVYDAKRFLQRNRSIIEDAPLQIYHSGLIFTPKSSVTRKQFSKEIPPWVTRLPAVAESWSTLLSTLEGHSNWVNAVAFSPDGAVVASASRDNTVRLWDAATGAARSTLEGHSNWVNAVAFSPDGAVVASASRDNTVRLWDAATGAARSTLEGHSNWVNAVAFSPDGAVVASASRDNTVRLWDAATGAARSTLEGHSNWVNAVAFSPDSTVVASASRDNTVRLWDAATGAARSTLEGHSNSVQAVAFSPDGAVVASASWDNTVRLWDAATGAARSTLEGHSDWVNAVAFSPDGAVVASASSDNTVRLWDAATGAARSTLEGHSNWVSAVAFSPDGAVVASASNDNTVRLWDAATGAARSTLEGHSNWVSAVAFSPDGAVVASASRDNTVRLWDAVTGAARSTLEGHSKSVNAVAFSPDGAVVASASRDNTVRLWDAATGAARSTLEGHWKSVNAVAFSPDGTVVASASRDNTVRLWDAATGAARSTLEGHWNSVQAVAFSPDGAVVASASNDNTVRLWDAATGAARSTLEGHWNWVSAVAFSPDGAVVASASWDNTVRLWDAATGAARSTLEVPGLVRELRFEADGSRLWTERGMLELDVLPQSSKAQSQSDASVTLFVSHQWLVVQNEDILWLPPDYRATSSAVFGSTIVLGHSSGQITFVEIDSSKLYRSN